MRAAIALKKQTTMSDSFLAVCKRIVEADSDRDSSTTGLDFTTNGAKIAVTAFMKQLGVIGDITSTGLLPSHGKTLVLVADALVKGVLVSTSAGMWDDLSRQVHAATAAFAKMLGPSAAGATFLLDILGAAAAATAHFQAFRQLAGSPSEAWAIGEAREKLAAVQRLAANIQADAANEAFAQSQLVSASLVKKFIDTFTAALASDMDAVAQEIAHASTEKLRKSVAAFADMAYGGEGGQPWTRDLKSGYTFQDYLTCATKTLFKFDGRTFKERHDKLLEDRGSQTVGWGWLVLGLWLHGPIFPSLSSFFPHPSSSFLSPPPLSSLLLAPHPFRCPAFPVLHLLLPLFLPSSLLHPLRRRGPARRSPSSPPL
eukprot:5560748-Pyramimonas_sp.AAC.1